MNEKHVKAIALGALALAVTSPSFAVIDTAAVMTELDAMPGYMVSVGTALILAAATAIGFKWIKGAIFS